ncbi:MAG: aminotransferase class IV [Bacteroidota bacterium]|nr:aminotransferase class IV [Bacteroidota bacterium]
MINFNGNIIPKATNQLYNNRAFLFADAVFETLKVVEGKVLFLEDHYFRLMSSMRIMRMEIPMNFTMEFLETQIVNIVAVMPSSPSHRVRVTVYRNAEGLYCPKGKDVGYIIESKPLDNALYEIKNQVYEVELYKDFYLPKHLLSSIKSTNKTLNITASIFAEENDYQNVLLINESKNVVEATNANLFMLKDGKLITPPLSEGAVAGILRKQILTVLAKQIEVPLIEDIISPFDLQKADELFLTNVIAGIIPIIKYRKKEYKNDFAKLLLEKLNTLLAK